MGPQQHFPGYSAAHALSWPCGHSPGVRGPLECHSHKVNGCHEGARAGQGAAPEWGLMAGWESLEEEEREAGQWVGICAGERPEAEDRRRQSCAAGEGRTRPQQVAAPATEPTGLQEGTAIPRALLCSLWLLFPAARCPQALETAVATRSREFASGGPPCITFSQSWGLRGLEKREKVLMLKYALGKRPNRRGEGEASSSTSFAA